VSFWKNLVANSDESELNNPHKSQNRFILNDKKDLNFDIDWLVVTNDENTSLLHYSILPLLQFE
jgi:hypothetical protein